MKKLLLFLPIAVLLVIGAFAYTTQAAVRSSGYFRSSGTYVQPYYRSSPNSYRFDNYSSKGNYNPYTGKSGTKNYYGW